MKLLSRPRHTVFRCARRLCSAPPADAETVVVGGGVIGTSVAYHLARAGMKGVVLLEARSLASASSSSFHSPGLVTASHPVHRYKPILAKSVAIYGRLEQETGEKVDFHQTGTLRLATNPQRVEEFKLYTARDYYRQGDSCRTQLIDTARVRELCPILNADKVLAALYTTGDGYINTVGLTRAFAIGARTAGATVLENCSARAIERDGDFWAIATDMGTIRTKHVVNAAGLWAREFAHKTGIDLPLLHFEHQWLETSKLPQLDQNMPAVIDQESPFYLRRNGDSIMFGAFESSENAQACFREDWTFDRMPDDASMRLPPHFDRIRAQWQRAIELLPVLASAEVRPAAGVMTMAPDQFPMIGPVSGLSNYWLATGAFDGISSAGGLGSYLADWMVNSEPPFESFDMDANRYRGWADRKFLVARGIESFTSTFNWSLPDHRRPAGRPTFRVSGIYGALKKDGADMQFRSGWEVPAYFTVSGESEMSTLAREYQKVTNNVGVVDLSYKGKIEVRGRDSVKFLEYLLASRLPEFGGVAQSLMLTHSGRVLSAMKILHHDQFSQKGRFMLLTDPENELRDIGWMEKIRSEHNFNVTVNAISEYLASMALIGPLSRHLLQELNHHADVSEQGFPPNTTRLLRVGNVTCIACRASATGELGWELFHMRADTLKLYEAICKAGQAFGVINFGMKTLNTLRIEKGYKIWGRELSLNTNAYEAGIESFIDFTKKDFVGRAACQALSQKQPDRRLELITVDTLQSEHSQRDIPVGNEVVRVAGDEQMVGYVTSGCYSHLVQKPLCFAWVQASVAKDARLTVNMRNELVMATILTTPPAAVTQ